MSMGIDIHYQVQVKAEGFWYNLPIYMWEEGKAKNVDAGIPAYLGYRDYTLYGILAGVVKRAAIIKEPIGEPDGLELFPTPHYHNQTWYYCAELATALSKLILNQNGRSLRLMCRKLVSKYGNVRIILAFEGRE